MKQERFYALDVFRGRRIEIDDVLGVTRSDRDFFHVDVGCMQQRAAIGHRHGRDRARHVLGTQRGAFERVDGDDQDPYQVVGCVKSSLELAQMGAEHFDTSVVLGELAYTVEPGFLAVPVGPDGTETLMDGAAWGRLRTTLTRMAG